METLERSRRAFADEIRALADLSSEMLWRAFAAVPREQFLGPGPWYVLSPRAPERYEPTADPRHLYANVLVAIDPGRHLNSGEPAALARWLDRLELGPGARFLHIGCGLGYYTAIAAECVGSTGRVVAVELDPRLAERARRNLAHWPWVSVIGGDANAIDAGTFDAIFVNAGATELPLHWLELLADAGRLLVPLTVDLPLEGFGGGNMLRVVRRGRAFGARFVSPVGIFHLAGARTAEGNLRLRRAYTHGDTVEVCSVRRDPHAPDPSCWLHGLDFCLSRLALAEEPW